MFGVFPVLSLWAGNAYMVSGPDAWRSFVASLLVASIWWIICVLVTREIYRGSLLASLMYIPSSIFGRLFEPLASWLSLQLVHGVIGLVVVLLMAVIIAVKLPAGRLSAATIIANRAGVVALLVSGLTVLLVPSRTLANTTANGAADAISQHRPDIIVMVLDGYARSDTLRRLYDFNNENFEKALEARGFSIDQSAVANYGQTYPAIASMMNMRYVDDMPEASSLVGSKSQDRGVLRVLIQEGAALRLLRAHGYRFVTFPSGYQATEFTNPDLSITSEWLSNEFEDALIDGSALAVIFRLVDFDQHESHRRRILNILDRIDTSTLRFDSPTFVFAHLLVPHPPFVFSRVGDPKAPSRGYTLKDGSHFREVGGSFDEYRGGYLEQLQFLNQSLLRAIDGLLEHSPTAVVILMGDHGPGLYLDHASLEATDVRERFSIFFAVRAGTGDFPLDDYPSPVNLFRGIFDSRLGVPMDPLPVESYYSPWDAPYQFTEVSDALSLPLAKGGLNDR